MFKSYVQHLLRQAGVQCNGPNPWDPCILDESFYRKVVLGGSLGFGDTYREGGWECPDLEGLVRRIFASGISDSMPRLDSFLMKLAGLLDRHDREGSMRVAREHYDLDDAFFMRFLGKTGIYTCAYWEEGDTLDTAQVRKMDRICRKAELVRGETVLDIGCGWGGFLAHAREKYGTRGIGLSISKTQLEHAWRRYPHPALDYRFCDYRDFAGKADKIVSICMIEHVGWDNLPLFFDAALRALKPGGLFVLQCIFARDDAHAVDPWINKHIFPGGMLMTEPRLHAAIQGRFHVLDWEYFGSHYAKTHRAWHANLSSDRNEIVRRYGEEWYRTFELYFLGSASAFDLGRINVAQIVLSPEARPDYVPIR